MSECKLWILRPRAPYATDPYRPVVGDPWEPWYDKTFGLVVRAPTEERARQLAAEKPHDECSDAWLSDKYSTCEVLSTVGPEEVVMRDFHAA